MLLKEHSGIQHRHSIRHKLLVNGENWSDRLLDASVQFRADAGSSGMEFSVTGSTEDYKDASVNFWLGDGHDIRPYFVGTLQGPNDDERLHTSTARAFGPFKDMNEQVLGSNETFQGHTLEWVILNCARRTDRRPGDIVVINGGQYKVQQGEQFPFDNKIGDVISSLMEKANFVGVDQPGGRREFMPRPRPGSNENFSRTLDMDDYMEFNLSPSNETNFSKVVVYRNGDNGKPVVYAERDVNPLTGKTPPRNRWYVVSDFPGTQKEAGDEAFRIALELRMGLSSFDLTLPFDRNVRVFGGFKAATIKRGMSKTYACFVDDGFTVEYSPGSPAIMSIGGTAHEITKERKKIRIPEKREVIAPAIVPNILTATFSPVGIPHVLEANGNPNTTWPNNYASPNITYDAYTGGNWTAYAGSFDDGNFWVDQAHLGFDTSSLPSNAVIESATLSIYPDAVYDATPTPRSVGWFWHPWNTGASAKDRFLFDGSIPNANSKLSRDYIIGQYNLIELFNGENFINRDGITGLASRVNPQSFVPIGQGSGVRWVRTPQVPTLTVRYRIP